MRPLFCLFAILSCCCLTSVVSGSPALATLHQVRVGSKSFTESVILGEIVSLRLQETGVPAVHRRELGGTRVLWDALVKGEIDIYPEYTGTIRQEIMAGRGIQGDEAVEQALARYGVRMTRSLGFSDNYAIGMKREVSNRLGIRRLSDLRAHPGLIFGFSNEFMDRGDGWPGLRLRYGLPQKKVFGLDHDLAYRGLNSGSIDATDLYSTDAEIAHYGLTTLEDDLHYFPVYTAVVLYRADLGKRSPQAVAALSDLEGKISEVDMLGMNESVKKKRVAEGIVAGEFVTRKLGLNTASTVESTGERIWKHTREHIKLVSLSLLAAILIAIPLGITAAKLPGPGQLMLSLAGIDQTIPSLALLVFMIPFLGIGAPPVIVALFLYSILPIMRNTHSGLHNIGADIRSSAEALGLPPRARLMLIELPMASREIMAGIKTSAVINVGTATLGALVGAGGYGQPILTGIRLDNVGLILQGAVPAALLALAVQGAFELAEMLVVPKGLRLRPGR